MSFNITRYSYSLFLFSILMFVSRGLNAQSNLPKPDHILILIEENHSSDSVIGNTVAAAFTNMVAHDTNACIFTKMYAIMHPSQPNYLCFFSGSNQGVTNDQPSSSYPFLTRNLARELMDAGYSFKTFSQNLPSVGYDGVSSNGYVRKHNPVTNWVGSGPNLVPDSLNQPLTNLPSDYSFLPTVSYVVPVQDSDMHNGVGNAAIAAADYWFQEHLEPYIQWVLTHNSLLIYTFDEDDGFSGNRIPFFVYGPMVKGGVDTNLYNHYSVLRTLEDMYGCSTHAGNAATATPITTCWKTVSTGISMDENTSALTVYPNPSNNVIKFEVSGGEKLNTSLSVSNISGQQLGSYHFPPTGKLSLNTSYYPTGMYFYKMVQENQVVQSGRFLVTH